MEPTKRAVWRKLRRGHVREVVDLVAFVFNIEDLRHVQRRQESLG